MDEFIERSASLIRAQPTSTRVCTRFTHKKVGHGRNEMDSGLRPAVVVVKTYDPLTGTLYKYRATKVVELQKIMARLGLGYTHDERKESGFEKDGGAVMPGLASIMSDVEPVAESTEDQAEKPPAKQQQQQTHKRDMKKKKQKKR